MKVNRKTFLQQAGLGTAAMLGLPQLIFGQETILPVPSIYQGDDDEQFWESVRAQYVVHNSVINMNNGSVSPQAIPVQNAYIDKYKYANQAPSFFMWRKLNKEREPLRERLANMAGCQSSELAICRNTTEALNNIIFGLPLKAGDEVVLSNCDYPFAMNAWRQREARDGIILKWVNLDLPEEDEVTLVEKFAQEINTNTRVVHLTYIINWTGQILPVRKVADIAHAMGAQVLVDAAHAFAHIQHTIPETGADYYATSLHKWLGAPFGTGFLYVKKELIKAIWPLQSSYEHDSDDIIKLEQLGTRCVAAEMAIHDALNFYEQIGVERIEIRLRFLKQYWYERIAELDGLTLWTTRKSEQSCALASISIEKKTPGEIHNFLLAKAKIHTGIVHWGDHEGIRVTPHIYTATHELDNLVQHIKVLVAS